MIVSLLRESWDALQHSRRRSGLTIAGMAWGIATFVLLLAYGNGFGAAINNIFASFGMKTIIIFPGRTSMQAGGQKAGSPVRLTLDDVELLTSNLPQITRIAPEAFARPLIQYENRSFDFTTLGTTPNAAPMKVLEMDRGRFYDDADELQLARVAVLGWEAKDKLFSGRNAIGEKIHLNGVSFEVIGVLKPKMQEGDNEVNRMLYVPFKTLRTLTDTKYLNAIWIGYETEDYGQLESAIRSVLAEQHRFDPADRRAVNIFSLMVQVHQLRVMTVGLRILLGFIGALTLGIGGVGLMNIMLVAVTHRTREIGMLLAIGAKRKHIFLEFLAEAVTISFIGGVLGMVVAYGFALSIGKLTFYSAMAAHAEGGDIELIIRPGTVLIATAVLTLVGLASGMLPAMRASRLEPIESLRYE